MKLGITGKKKKKNYKTQICLIQIDISSKLLSHTNKYIGIKNVLTNF